MFAALETQLQRSRLWLDYRRKASPNPGAGSKLGGDLQRKRGRAQERKSRLRQERRCPRPWRPEKEPLQKPLRLDPQPVRLNPDAGVRCEDGQQRLHLGPQRPPRRERAHLANLERRRRIARRSAVERRGRPGQRTQISLLLL